MERGERRVDRVLGEKFGDRNIVFSNPRQLLFGRS